MTRIEKSIEINASPEKIWPLLQWDRSTEWYAPFKKVEYTSDKKNMIGGTVHVSGEIAGVKAEWDAENTELVENEKVAWRSIGGSFTGTGFNALNPTKTGTKVTIGMDYELPYSVLGKIIDKLRVQKAMKKSIEDGLKKLKALVET